MQEFVLSFKPSNYDLKHNLNLRSLCIFRSYIKKKKKQEDSGKIWFTSSLKKNRLKARCEIYRRDRVGLFQSQPVERSGEHSMTNFIQEYSRETKSGCVRSHMPCLRLTRLFIRFFFACARAIRAQRQRDRKRERQKYRLLEETGPSIIYSIIVSSLQLLLLVVIQLRQSRCAYHQLINRKYRTFFLSLTRSFHSCLPAWTQTDGP